MKIQISELNGGSAFDYCRFLVSRGHSPSDYLEVYRGDMLSYTIKPISWGASKKLSERSKGGFHLDNYKPFTKEDRERLDVA